MMGSKSRAGARRTRPPFTRGVMHALVLAAIGLVVGVTSLTVSAAEPEQGQDALPLAVIVPQTPADVRLKVGETAALDNGDLKVTLLAVTEDSRCPKDVMCVWSGRAVVALHVELDGTDHGEHTATLMPGQRGLSDLDAVVGRYRLSLTDVQPYPDRSHPEPTLETVAMLHVSGAP